MNIKKSIYLSVFFAFIFNTLPVASAKTLITCSHPELCRLAKIVFSENHMNDFEFQSLVKIVGDPHEYEPSTLEIKNLISAPILLTGPAELNPWIKKVNYQRSKNKGVKTISLLLDKSDMALYSHEGSHSSAEALSHFWLYPKVFCSLKTKLENQLTSLNMLVVVPTKKTCANEVQKIEALLSETMNGQALPLILTHDALLPLLENLGTNAKVVAIKGSGHHQETTPKAVKNLYNALKSEKVIWVMEKGIRIPQNVLAKKRANDLMVEIDTANSDGSEYFPVLAELNSKLKAIK